MNFPEKGVIEFGYGNEIWGTIAGEFLAESIPRLDKKRLPSEIRIVDDAFINRQKLIQDEGPENPLETSGT